MPILNGTDLMKRLRQSATDLGGPGGGAADGLGFLDPTAGSGPQGAPGGPPGQAVDRAGAAVGTSALQLGPAFGAGPELGDAIFLDRSGRPYRLDLDQRVRAPAPHLVLHRWLRQRRVQASPRTLRWAWSVR